jgi:hypothetical protein
MDYMKRNIPCLLILFLLPFTLFSQNAYRKEIGIPDIPGHRTLKCDFHVHTVFSDGLVWPTVRVDEAWRDGMDAIALTEHLESQPNEDVIGNRSRSYELAKPMADELGLVLIRGIEITHSMPPGHFNALFIKDPEKFDPNDWRKALEEAKAQGAYVFWNHPGWLQPDEIPIWYDEHTEIFSKGLAQGMEIVNERSYYPLAFRWCLEKNITLFGNSDIHNSLTLDYEEWRGDHRAMTLVFATEKSPDAIREALDMGHTAVYHTGLIIGKKEFLLPLFNNSIHIINPSVTIQGNGRALLQVQNLSEVTMVLETSPIISWFTIPQKIIIPGGKTAGIILQATKEMPGGVHDLKIPMVVKNFLVGPEEGMEVELVVRVNHLL